jgi:hypothetical protein
MSNFLRNVTARALADAAPVLPRIPSLFEPYRANDGPFVARAGPSPVEGDFEGRENSARGSGNGGQMPAGSRIGSPIGPGTGLRMPLAQSPTAEIFHAESNAAARPLQQSGADRTVTAQEAADVDARPSATARVPMAPVSASRNNSSPAETRAGQRGDVTAVRSGGERASSQPAESSRAAAVSFWRGERVKGPSSAVSPAAGGVVAPLRRAVDAGKLGAPAETRVAAPSSQAPASSQVDTRRAEGVLRPATISDAPASAERGQGADLPEARERARSAWTVQAPRPSSTPVVRPPVARQLDGAGPAPLRHASGPSLPDIQVTIGTVEVRALLPEKAVTHASLKPPKTGTSLDEYLKRSRRGAQ